MFVSYGVQVGGIPMLPFGFAVATSSTDAAYDQKIADTKADFDSHYDAMEKQVEAMEMLILSPNMDARVAEFRKHLTCRLQTRHQAKSVGDQAAKVFLLQCIACEKLYNQVIAAAAPVAAAGPTAAAAGPASVAAAAAAAAAGLKAPF
jgi:hypothetical protein